MGSLSRVGSGGKIGHLLLLIAALCFTLQSRGQSSSDTCEDLDISACQLSMACEVYNTNDGGTACQASNGSSTDSESDSPCDVKLNYSIAYPHGCPESCVVRDLQTGVQICDSRNFWDELGAVYWGDSGLPIGYLFWNFMLGFTVILIVRIAPAITARVVCRVINFWVLRPKKSEPSSSALRISSLRIALVGGRVTFEELEYASANMHLRIVEGGISLLWWRSSEGIMHDPAAFFASAKTSETHASSTSFSSKSGPPASSDASRKNGKHSKGGSGGGGGGGGGGDGGAIGTKSDQRAAGKIRVDERPARLTGFASGVELSIFNNVEKFNAIEKFVYKHMPMSAREASATNLDAMERGLDANHAAKGRSSMMSTAKGSAQGRGCCAIFVALFCRCTSGFVACWFSLYTFMRRCCPRSFHRLGTARDNGGLTDGSVPRGSGNVDDSEGDGSTYGFSSVHTGGNAEVDDQASIGSSSSSESPWFYQVFPVSKFELSQFCIYVSDPSMRTTLVMHAEKGLGIHYVEDSTWDTDYFKVISRLVWTDTRLRLVKNEQYVGEEVFALRSRQILEEDPLLERGGRAVVTFFRELFPFPEISMGDYRGSKVRSVELEEPATPSSEASSPLGAQRSPRPSLVARVAKPLYRSSSDDDDDDDDDDDVDDSMNTDDNHDQSYNGGGSLIGDQMVSNESFASDPGDKRSNASWRRSKHKQDQEQDQNGDDHDTSAMSGSGARARHDAKSSASRDGDGIELSTRGTGARNNSIDDVRMNLPKPIKSFIRASNGLRRPSGSRGGMSTASGSSKTASRTGGGGLSRPSSSSSANFYGDNDVTLQCTEDAEDEASAKYYGSYDEDDDDDEEEVQQRERKREDDDDKVGNEEVYLTESEAYSRTLAENRRSTFGPSALLSGLINANSSHSPRDYDSETSLDDDEYTAMGRDGLTRRPRYDAADFGRNSQLAGANVHPHLRSRGHRTRFQGEDDRLAQSRRRQRHRRRFQRGGAAKQTSAKKAMRKGRQNAAESAKAQLDAGPAEPDLLVTDKLELVYKFDVPGPITQEQIEAFDGKRQPEFSCEIFLGSAREDSHSILTYGPWADQERSHFLQRFWPMEYQETPVYRPEHVGEPRIPLFLDVRVMFRGRGSVRMPYRVRNTGWYDGTKDDDVPSNVNVWSTIQQHIDAFARASEMENEQKHRETSFAAFAGGAGRLDSLASTGLGAAERSQDVPEVRLPPGPPPPPPPPLPSHLQHQYQYDPHADDSAPVSRFRGPRRSSQSSYSSRNSMSVHGYQRAERALASGWIVHMPPATRISLVKTNDGEAVMASIANYQRELLEATQFIAAPENEDAVVVNIGPRNDPEAWACELWSKYAGREREVSTHLRTLCPTYPHSARLDDLARHLPVSREFENRVVAFMFSMQTSSSPAESRSRVVESVGAEMELIELLSERYGFDHPQLQEMRRVIRDGLARFPPEYEANLKVLFPQSGSSALAGADHEDFSSSVHEAHAFQRESVDSSLFGDEAAREIPFGSTSQEGVGAGNNFKVKKASSSSSIQYNAQHAISKGTEVGHASQCNGPLSFASAHGVACGWLDLDIAIGSDVVMSLPLVSRSESGYETIIDTTLIKPELRSSVTQSEILRSMEYKMRTSIHYSNQWNGHQLWSFNQSMKRSEVRFVREHVNCFMDLVSDWTSMPRSEADDKLEFFTPITYSIQADIDRVNLVLNVNEDNVIGTLTDDTYNHIVDVDVPRVQFRSEMQTVEFEAAREEISWTLSFENVKAANTWASTCAATLRLPEDHPRRQIVHPRPAMSESKVPWRNPRFLTFDRLEIEGRYVYHNEIADHTDLLKVDLHFLRPKLLALPEAVDAIANFQANYFGSAMFLTTPDDFAACGNNNLRSRVAFQTWTLANNVISRPPANEFELRFGLHINEGTVQLPICLQPCLNAQGDLQDADHSTVSLTTTKTVLDMRMNYDRFLDMDLRLDQVRLQCPSSQALGTAQMPTESNPGISTSVNAAAANVEMLVTAASERPGSAPRAHENHSGHSAEHDDHGRFHGSYESYTWDDAHLVSPENGVSSDLGHSSSMFFHSTAYPVSPISHVALGHTITSPYSPPGGDHAFVHGHGGDEHGYLGGHTSKHRRHRLPGKASTGSYPYPRFLEPRAASSKQRQRKRPVRENALGNSLQGHLLWDGGSYSIKWLYGRNENISMAPLVAYSSAMKANFGKLRGDLQMAQMHAVYDAADSFLKGSARLRSSDRALGGAKSFLRAGALLCNPRMIWTRIVQSKPSYLIRVDLDQVSYLPTILKSSASHSRSAKASGAVFAQIECNCQIFRAPARSGDKQAFAWNYQCVFFSSTLDVEVKILFFEEVYGRQQLVGKVILDPPLTTSTSREGMFSSSASLGQEGVPRELEFEDIVQCLGNPYELFQARAKHKGKSKTASARASLGTQSGLFVQMRSAKVDIDATDADPAYAKVRKLQTASHKKKPQTRTSAAMLGSHSYVYPDRKAQKRNAKVKVGASVFHIRDEVLRKVTQHDASLPTDEGNPKAYRFASARWKNVRTVHDTASPARGVSAEWFGSVPGLRRHASVSSVNAGGLASRLDGQGGEAPMESAASAIAAALAAELDSNAEAGALLDLGNDDYPSHLAVFSRKLDQTILESLVAEDEVRGHEKLYRRSTTSVVWGGVDVALWAPSGKSLVSLVVSPFEIQGDSLIDSQKAWFIESLEEVSVVLRQLSRVDKSSTRGSKSGVTKLAYAQNPSYARYVESSMFYNPYGSGSSTVDDLLDTWVQVGKVEGAAKICLEGRIPSLEVEASEQEFFWDTYNRAREEQVRQFNDVTASLVLPPESHLLKVSYKYGLQLCGFNYKLPSSGPLHRRHSFAQSGSSGSDVAADEGPLALDEDDDDDDDDDLALSEFSASDHFSPSGALDTPEYALGARDQPVFGAGAGNEAKNEGGLGHELDAGYRDNPDGFFSPPDLHSDENSSFRSARSSWHSACSSVSATGVEGGQAGEAGLFANRVGSAVSSVSSVSSSSDSLTSTSSSGSSLSSDSDSDSGSDSSTTSSSSSSSGSLSSTASSPTPRPQDPVSSGHEERFADTQRGGTTKRGDSGYISSSEDSSSDSEDSSMDSRSYYERRGLDPGSGDAAPALFVSSDIRSYTTSTRVSNQVEVANLVPYLEHFDLETTQFSAHEFPAPHVGTRSHPFNATSSFAQGVPANVGESHVQYTSIRSLGGGPFLVSVNQDDRNQLEGRMGKEKGNAHDRQHGKKNDANADADVDADAERASPTGRDAMHSQILKIEAGRIIDVFVTPQAARELEQALLAYYPVAPNMDQLLNFFETLYMPSPSGTSNASQGPDVGVVSSSLRASVQIQGINLRMLHTSVPLTERNRSSRRSRRGSRATHHDNDTRDESQEHTRSSKAGPELHASHDRHHSGYGSEKDASADARRIYGDHHQRSSPKRRTRHTREKPVPYLLQSCCRKLSITIEQQVGHTVPTDSENAGAAHLASDMAPSSNDDGAAAGGRGGRGGGNSGGGGDTAPSGSNDGLAAKDSLQSVSFALYDFEVRLGIVGATIDGEHEEGGREPSPLFLRDVCNVASFGVRELRANGYMRSPHYELEKGVWSKADSAFNLHLDVLRLQCGSDAIHAIYNTTYVWIQAVQGLLEARTGVYFRRRHQWALLAGQVVKLAMRLEQLYATNEAIEHEKDQSLLELCPREEWLTEQKHGRVPLTRAAVLNRLRRIACFIPAYEQLHQEIANCQLDRNAHLKPIPFEVLGGVGSYKDFFSGLAAFETPLSYAATSKFFTDMFEGCTEAAKPKKLASFTRKPEDFDLAVSVRGIDMKIFVSDVPSRRAAQSAAANAQTTTTNSGAAATRTTTAATATATTNSRQELREAISPSLSRMGKEWYTMTVVPAKLLCLDCAFAGTIVSVHKVVTDNKAWAAAHSAKNGGGGGLRGDDDGLLPWRFDIEFNISAKTDRTWLSLSPEILRAVSAARAVGHQADAVLSDYYKRRLFAMSMHAREESRILYNEDIAHIEGLDPFRAVSNLHKHDHASLTDRGMARTRKFRHVASKSADLNVPITEARDGFKFSAGSTQTKNMSGASKAGGFGAIGELDQDFYTIRTRGHAASVSSAGMETRSNESARRRGSAIPGIMHPLHRQGHGSPFLRPEAGGMDVPRFSLGPNASSQSGGVAGGEYSSFGVGSGVPRFNEIGHGPFPEAQGPMAYETMEDHDDDDAKQDPADLPNATALTSEQVSVFFTTTIEEIDAEVQSSATLLSQKAVMADDTRAVVQFRDFTFGWSRFSSVLTRRTERAMLEDDHQEKKGANNAIGVGSPQGSSGLRGRLRDFLLLDIAECTGKIVGPRRSRSRASPASPERPIKLWEIKGVLRGLSANLMLAVATSRVSQGIGDELLTDVRLILGSEEGSGKVPLHAIDHARLHELVDDWAVAYKDASERWKAFARVASVEQPMSARSPSTAFVSHSHLNGAVGSPASRPTSSREGFAHASGWPKGEASSHQSRSTQRRRSRRMSIKDRLEDLANKTSVLDDDASGIVKVRYAVVVRMRKLASAIQPHSKLIMSYEMESITLEMRNKQDGRLDAQLHLGKSFVGFDKRRRGFDSDAGSRASGMDGERGPFPELSFEQSLPCVWIHASLGASKRRLPVTTKTGARDAEDASTVTRREALHSRDEEEDLGFVDSTPAMGKPRHRKSNSLESLSMMSDIGSRHESVVAPVKVPGLSQHVHDKEDDKELVLRLRVVVEPIRNTFTPDIVEQFLVLQTGLASEINMLLATISRVSARFAKSTRSRRVKRRARARARNKRAQQVTRASADSLRKEPGGEAAGNVRRRSGDYGARRPPLHVDTGSRFSDRRRSSRNGVDGSSSSSRPDPTRRFEASREPIFDEVVHQHTRPMRYALIFMLGGVSLTALSDEEENRKIARKPFAQINTGKFELLVKSGLASDFAAPPQGRADSGVFVVPRQKDVVWFATVNFRGLQISLKRNTRRVQGAVLFDARTDLKMLYDPRSSARKVPVAKSEDEFGVNQAALNQTCTVTIDNTRIELEPGFFDSGQMLTDEYVQALRMYRYMRANENAAAPVTARPPASGAEAISESIEQMDRYVQLVWKNVRDPIRSELKDRRRYMTALRQLAINVGIDNTLILLPFQTLRNTPATGVLFVEEVRCRAYVKNLVTALFEDHAEARTASDALQHQQSSPLDSAGKGGTTGRHGGVRNAAGGEPLQHPSSPSAKHPGTALSHRKQSSLVGSLLCGEIQLCVSSDSRAIASLGLDANHDGSSSVVNAVSGDMAGHHLASLSTSSSSSTTSSLNSSAQPQSVPPVSGQQTTSATTSAGRSKSEVHEDLVSIVRAAYASSPIRGRIPMVTCSVGGRGLSEEVKLTITSTVAGPDTFISIGRMPLLAGLVATHFSSKPQGAGSQQPSASRQESQMSHADGGALDVDEGTLPSWHKLRPRTTKLEVSMRILEGPGLLFGTESEQLQRISLPSVSSTLLLERSWEESSWSAGAGEAGEDGAGRARSHTVGSRRRASSASSPLHMMHASSRNARSASEGGHEDVISSCEVGAFYEARSDLKAKVEIRVPEFHVTPLLLQIVQHFAQDLTEHRCSAPSFGASGRAAERRYCGETQQEEQQHQTQQQRGANNTSFDSDAEEGISLEDKTHCRAYDEADAQSQGGETVGSKGSNDEPPTHLRGNLSWNVHFQVHPFQTVSKFGALSTGDDVDAVVGVTRGIEVSWSSGMMRMREDDEEADQFVLECLSVCVPEVEMVINRASHFSKGTLHAIQAQVNRAHGLMQLPVVVSMVDVERVHVDASIWSIDKLYGLQYGWQRDWAEAEARLAKARLAKALVRSEASVGASSTASHAAVSPQDRSAPGVSAMHGSHHEVSSRPAGEVAPLSPREGDPESDMDDDLLLGTLAAERRKPLATMMIQTRVGSVDALVDLGMLHSKMRFLTVGLAGRYFQPEKQADETEVETTHLYFETRSVMTQFDGRLEGGMRLDTGMVVHLMRDSQNMPPLEDLLNHPSYISANEFKRYQESGPAPAKEWQRWMRRKRALNHCVFRLRDRLCAQMALVFGNDATRQRTMLFVLDALDFSVYISEVIPDNNVCTQLVSIYSSSLDLHSSSEMVPILVKLMNTMREQITDARRATRPKFFSEERQRHHSQADGEITREEAPLVDTRGADEEDAATMRSLKAVGTIYFEIGRFEVSVVHGVLNDVRRSAAAGVAIDKSAKFSLEVEKRRQTIVRELVVELHGNCDVVRFQKLLVKSDLSEELFGSPPSPPDLSRSPPSVTMSSSATGRQGGGLEAYDANDAASSQIGKAQQLHDQRRRPTFGSSSFGAGASTRMNEVDAASVGGSSRASGDGPDGGAEASRGARQGPVQTAGADPGGLPGLESRRHQKGRKRVRGIFGFPPLKLRMETLQNLISPDRSLTQGKLGRGQKHFHLVPAVDYVFRSEFMGPLNTTTDIRDLTYLREIAQSCTRSWAGRAPHSGSEASSTTEGAGIEVPGPTEPSDSRRAFKPNTNEREPFVFNPQVSVLGDATTIALNLAMSQLDLNKDTLPEKTHILLTDNLEIVLAAVHDGLRGMDRAFGDR